MRTGGLASGCAATAAGADSCVSGAVAGCDGLVGASVAGGRISCAVAVAGGGALVTTADPDVGLGSGTSPSFKSGSAVAPALDEGALDGALAGPAAWLALPQAPSSRASKAIRLACRTIVLRI